MRGSAIDDGRSPQRGLVALILLWLSGAGLRLTVLAVPPVIPLIHADLHLSETGIGILSALPSFLFAFAAIPGSLLVARFGALSTLVAGLLLTAAASALRGAVPDALLLYGTTFLMSFGIAIMQPALPRIVRDWLPHRIGFATAVYSNGLLVGETVAVALTIPLVLPLAAGSWRLSFVIWALPVLATALLVAALAPRPAGVAAAASAHAARWWPDWRSPLLWRLGLALSCVNSLYFCTNFFLPDYLHKTGRADLIGPALTALNLCQLPASFLILAFAGRLMRRRLPYIVCGLLSLASVLGLMALPGAWVVACAGLLGFSTAAMLILTLALPPLLSLPHDVHRMSAGMFTISYSGAVIMPILSGLVWDATGVPGTVFVPIGLCALAIPLLARGFRFDSVEESRSPPVAR